MIGLYAHHQGSGHLRRCRSIQEALSQPAQILSSRPGADITLDDDAGANNREYPEVSAGETLHYAPYHHAGMRERMATIADWVNTHRPEAFYVDVSVEVAVFVRLMGVPVVTLAMPGARQDTPHQLGYAQAEAILAAWPDWVTTPPHLAPHADALHPVGGISRLWPEAGIDRDPHRVVVLSGAGGNNWDAASWAAVQRACPDYSFEFLGATNFVEDPTAHLQTAGVVVAAAGQNSIADLAVTNTPAIIIPQHRPFDEQHATEQVLDEEGLAVVVDTFPAPENWPALIQRAQQQPTRWEKWQCEGAARRAARVIEEVAQRCARK